MGLVALVIVVLLVAVVVAGGWRRIPIRSRGETGVEPPEA